MFSSGKRFPGLFVLCGWGVGGDPEVRYFTPITPAPKIAAKQQQKVAPIMTKTPTISAIVVVETPSLYSLLALANKYLAIERGSPKLGSASGSLFCVSLFGFILPG